MEMFPPLEKIVKRSLEDARNMAETAMFALAIWPNFMSDLSLKSSEIGLFVVFSSSSSFVLVT